MTTLFNHRVNSYKNIINRSKSFKSVDSYKYFNKKYDNKLNTYNIKAKNDIVILHRKHEKIDIPVSINSNIEKENIQYISTLIISDVPDMINTYDLIDISDEDDYEEMWSYYDSCEYVYD